MQSFAQARIPPEVFHFSGQSAMDTWTLRDLFQAHGWNGYDAYLSHEPELCFQRIRELASEFPTWQHQPRTGRRQIDERTHLIGLMVRQFLQGTFRQTESYLHLLREYFAIPHVPDANTLSRVNRSWRFVKLLKRFHAWILDRLPRRKSTIATDATGYINAKKVWSQTDFGLRATQGWTKAHAAVEVPQLLILHSEKTEGRVHESQMFEPVWQHLPDNVRPIRSLADSAYVGDECLETARAFGATPFHAIKHNARNALQPESDYEKLVHFARHRPNRFRSLTRLRGLVETTFNCVKNRFGDRLRCRTKFGRVNEVQTKETCHNLRVLTAREFIAKV